MSNQSQVLSVNVAPVLMDGKALAQRIDTVHAGAKMVMLEYQACGLAVIRHLMEHGDVSLVNRLYKGMPKGAKSAAMGKWLLLHAAVMPNTDKGTKEAMPLKYCRDKVCNLEAAMQVNWYDLMPEPKVDEIFDLSKVIAMALKKAQGKDIKINGVTLSGEAKLTAIEALKAFVKPATV